MAVVNQAVVEVFNLMARGPDGTQTITSGATPLGTDFSPASTSPSTTNNGSGSSTSQSPLLFFVALGFGVVFTNLWIIVGVKYCFRYNARNRALARDGEGEPINLDPIPRPHRRRREKKLMTMDEVNERFPMTKYKAWVATRAGQGLSTAGGVTASASRPADVRNVDVGVPSSPVETKHFTDDRPTTAISSEEPPPVTPSTRAINDLNSAEKADIITEGHEMVALKEVTTVATLDAHKVHSEDEDDEDDHIHDALPPEMIAHPGDSCAICIDTLEDDDDIRGLTCGHAFHAGCLDPWLTSRRACCPLCKADYFIPKPRPEGESAEAERPRRSGRMQIPAQPRSAWLGVRGHPRLLLSGRLMSNPLYASNSYGYPQSDDRRLRRSRRSAAPTSVQLPPAGENSSRPGFASRIAAANPFNRIAMPAIRFPRRGRRDESTEIQSAGQPTPGQLESGVVR